LECDLSEGHRGFRAHGPGDFHLSGWLRGRSLNAFSVRPRGPQFSNEDPFRLLLCGIPHEHRTLIVLPLISPDIRIRFWQQVDCRDCPSGVLAPQQRADSSCTLNSRRSKNPRRPAALSFKPKRGNAISTCAHFGRFRGLQRYASVRPLQR
jgi:hypothetical protein